MPEQTGEILKEPKTRPFFQEPKNFSGWLRRRFRRRSEPSARTMLPLLIKVFAGFSKLDGKIVEDDIDSSLGFLRHDYPEALYSELRELYKEALAEPQDLNETAQKLADQLNIEEKILLGVQLYVLISRAQFQKQQLLAFYLFMTNLGVASEAIDIVYQLNTNEEVDAGEKPDIPHPLDSLVIAKEKPADVTFETLPVGYSISAFRFENLVLIKNTGSRPIIGRGRQVSPGEFCRLFDGQRILLVDFVLDYQDLIFYFNAKKNVSSTKLYLTFGSQGSPHIEKTLSRETYLEFVFGLNTSVRALRDSGARINGTPLKQGTGVEVSLGDRIIFKNQSEITLAELRKRAQELGGSFNLTPSRSEYLVSNDPDQLREGDILLSHGTSGNLLLKIHCNYEEKTGELEIINSSQPLSIGGVQIKDRVTLADGDTITIAEGQYLRCNFTERTIEEERNIISQLEARDLSHSYDDRGTAMDAISFTVKRGEMVCVIGPSGCGKSTLLRSLAGHLKPNQGKVLLNGFPLYGYPESLTPFISYIPHEDAFDPLLSVKENIDTSATIRAPHLRRSERNQRVEAKLAELNLQQLSSRLAGTPEDKFLSGGERKRLNVGLDMVAISDVFLIDEPTSGLSSKDSEHVIDIIRGIAHNKIIFVSIHQPSAKLFRMFHRALLLDKGGKMTFFGTPDEMLHYFNEAYEEEVGHQGAMGTIVGRAQAAFGQPDFVFDILEMPLRDLGGDVIYEKDNRGHFTAARRFPPDFWRDRFQAHRIVEDAKQSASSNSRDQTREFLTAPPQRQIPTPPVRRLRDEISQLGALLRRAFLSKLRNRANLVTTLLEAPLLAILVATVLRYSEDGGYTYATAFHIPTYLFLTLVIGMFLGLTNSADEIIRDRALLQRERNQNVRLGYYIASKLGALAVFAFIQCFIYLLIGNAILEVRGVFLNHLGWMFLTALNGVAIGLFISSLVRDAKTAINWIPVVLIPQIILGGALIKYEEMNQNLDFVYRIQRWASLNGGSKNISPPGSRLQVPFICQFMPLRWSYESIVVAQANHNPIASAQRELETTIRSFAEKKELTGQEKQALDHAKQALAITSGIERPSPEELSDTLKKIMKTIREQQFKAEDYTTPENSEASVSGEEIFVNQKILDLVTKAEMERLDYREKKAQNVFFGSQKRYFKTGFDTLFMNRVMLFLFIAIALCALYGNLHRQLTRVT